MSQQGADQTGDRTHPNAETFVSPSDHHEYDDEESNNHFALLYETQDQQFSAAIPFIKEGYDRNERCVYVLDDNSEADVLEAMREIGIDVDAARESGQLVLYTPEETYLDSGSFDREAMIDFWKRSLSEAHDAGYTGIRAAAEMTWVLESDTPLDELREYEDALNTVYKGEAYAVLCQYNRERFPPEFYSPALDHHPKLIFDETVAENFYYVSPDEEIDRDDAGHAIEHQLSTLVDRVQAEETLRQRETGLEALARATQELMNADADEIADRAADLSREVLDVEFTSFWPYNEHTGELELEGSSTSLETNVTALAELYEESAWEAFVSEQADARNHLQPSERLRESETPLRSGVIVPVGRHGVFCAGSTRPNVFDGVTVDLARMIGTSIETALDRAERERTLEERTEQLERVNRINSIIRGITNALVEVDTRSEIEQIVCDRLATSDHYRFVWIGDRDVDTDRVTPRARAGEGDGYLDELTITTDDTPAGNGPIGTAVRTRATQVVRDVLTDSTFKPWREQTLAHGFRSCLSVPLQHGESFYGVLNLYADVPNAFDEAEQEVLDELGVTIAHSIEAAETRRTLRAESVIELTVEIPDPDDPLTRLARNTGSRIDFEGFVPQVDGPSQLFFRTHGCSPDTVMAAGEQETAIESLELVDQQESTHLFKAIVTGPTLGSYLIEQQALIRSITVDDETTTVIVDLPETTRVREFLNQLRERYPDNTLVARQSRDRTIRSCSELRDAVRDRLTDRQMTILETAYLSGFFESPRAMTGKELAESLGVSQPTFSHHLRAAEKTLCEMLFETSNSEQ